MQYTITFEGPTEVLESGVILYAKAMGWTEMVQSDGPDLVSNPETAKQYAERVLKESVFRTIRKYREQQAIANAKTQAQAEHKTQMDRLT
tara:strand:+ start:306 stop:575 length:270 start_codon:yes stop_codon:yes gene_type:complete